jgi:RNA polymerase sigma factor for flagellar operon FliA
MYAASNEKEVETRVRELAPLVKRIAHHMMASLPPSVEIDDVIQSGMMGLLDAARRYQTSEGAQFETYAVQRIRGAMLDELRGGDWMSRGTRRQQREIEAAVHRLEQRLGRAPSESEIAAEMGLSLTEYQELLGKVRGTQLVYLEDMSGDDGDDDYLDRHVTADDGPGAGALLRPRAEDLFA